MLAADHYVAWKIPPISLSLLPVFLSYRHSPCLLCWVVGSAIVLCVLLKGHASSFARLLEASSYPLFWYKIVRTLVSFFSYTILFVACTSNPNCCTKIHRRSASSRQLGALDVPVFLRVILDGAVRAELAHLRGSPDALLDPLDAILVGFVYHRKSLDIRVEVLGQQVIVVLTDSVEKRLVYGAVAESSRRHLVQDSSQRGAFLFDGDRMIPVLVAQVLDSRCQVTEEKDVLLSDLFCDLDVRTVDSSDKQTAVQTELHVRSARGLSSSSGYVLADVRSRNQHLRERDGVVREEVKTEKIFRVGVGIEDACSVDDKADSQFGNIIARGRLSGKEDDLGIDCLPLFWGHRFQREVSMNDAHDVEGLALVLMQTLDLHVEHRMRIDLQAQSRLDVMRKTLLVALLDRGTLLLEGGIVCMFQQTLQLE